MVGALREGCCEFHTDRPDFGWRRTGKRPHLNNSGRATAGPDAIVFVSVPVFVRPTRSAQFPVMLVSEFLLRTVLKFPKESADIPQAWTKTTLIVRLATHHTYNNLHSLRIAKSVVWMLAHKADGHTCPVHPKQLGRRFFSCSFVATARN